MTETQINYSYLRVEMANNEHLLMLQRGVREWNAWRTARADTPFLQSANLANLDLKGIDFNNADLRDVRFDHSNLGSANFSGANLVGANFVGAFLIGAKFNTNDWSVPAALCDYANFTCAHLSEANMSGAHFVSADFQEADLINAKLVKSELTRANLRNVKAAPLIDKERVLATVRSYFGATVPDLSDDEVQELRRLCEVFLQPWSDAGQMENERKAALVRAKLPIESKDLEAIFSIQAASDSGSMDLIAQLKYDIDGLEGANFLEANLTEANLSGASLVRANLRGANLSKAVLVGTNLKYANLSGASVYGIAAWDVELDGAVQNDLSIGRTAGAGADSLTVDQIEVAQFLYLLLNNDAVRKVIDTITSKVVLILGRFTPERKALLDGIKGELRKRHYVPVLFDFEKPSSLTLTETIETLAHMARFIVADLTDAKSILQELRGIVPDLPSVPVLPLLLTGQTEPGMTDFFKRFPWFMSIVQYDDPTKLLTGLPDLIVAPAELKWKELNGATT